MSKEHGLLDLRHKQPKRVEFVANYNDGISKSAVWLCRAL